MIRIFNAFIIASGGGARRSSILPVALAARRAGQATFRASVPEGLASFGWGHFYLFLKQNCEKIKRLKANLFINKI